MYNYIRQTRNVGPEFSVRNNSDAFWFLPSKTMVTLCVSSFMTQRTFKITPLLCVCIFVCLFVVNRSCDSHYIISTILQFIKKNRTLYQNTGFIVYIRLFVCLLERSLQHTNRTK